MTLESKPLFHPEVLRQQVRAFNLPERVGDYGLTPAEIALMWQTAPPRMPHPAAHSMIASPASQMSSL